MALYKKAVQRLIKPGPNDPRLDVVVGTIGHVAVSMADSLHDWFNGPSGGVESHFYIRLSGVVEQYRDTAFEADAQGAGNSWVTGGKRHGFISYETEGMGSGTWSAAQLVAIKDLIEWGRSVHHYPMVKATGPHGVGHGYHALFDSWNPNGHACPGKDRIKQFNNIIVPWLSGAGTEDDVSVQDLLNAPVGTNPGTKKPSDVREALDIAKNYSYLAWKEQIAQRSTLAALTAAVKTLAESKPGLDPEAILTAVRESADEATAKGVQEALSNVELVLKAGGASDNPVT